MIDAAELLVVARAVLVDEAQVAIVGMAKVRSFNFGFFKTREIFWQFNCFKI